MEEPFDSHSRVVHIDEKVQKGIVELPSVFFQYTGIEPGHHVVLSHMGDIIKARSKVNDDLHRSQIGITPLLAETLNLYDGESVLLEDRTTIGDRVFDEAEDIFERLERGADRIADAVEDIGDRVEDELKDVMDRIDPDRTPPTEKGYVEVSPDLDDVAASPPEEPVKDIQEQVDVWTPDPDGDGTVPVFRPGKDEEEEEP